MKLWPAPVRLTQRNNFIDCRVYRTKINNNNNKRYTGTRGVVGEGGEARERPVLDTYQLDELRQPEAQLDQHGVGVVADGPDEPVIVAEQVVVQSLGVGVAQTPGRVQQEQRQRLMHRTSETAAFAAWPTAAIVNVIVGGTAVVNAAVSGRRRHCVARANVYRSDTLPAVRRIADAVRILTDRHGQRWRRQRQSRRVRRCAARDEKRASSPPIHNAAAHTPIRELSKAAGRRRCATVSAREGAHCRASF